MTSRKKGLVEAQEEMNVDSFHVYAFVDDENEEEVMLYISVDVMGCQSIDRKHINQTACHTNLCTGFVFNNVVQLFTIL
jgi:hypothetical protein